MFAVLAPGKDMKGPSEKVKEFLSRSGTPGIRSYRQMKGLLSANLKGYLGLCHQMGQINLLLCPRPLIKELGAVTKGRDYSGAGLLSGIRPDHCTVSVGIRQCISLAEDSQMSCGPMQTGILPRPLGAQPEFKAHKMRGLDGA